MNRQNDILDRRTAALAAEHRATLRDEAAGTEYVVLNAGSFRFALPVEATEMVVGYVGVVPLPDTPRFLSGVVQHDGRLFSVLDLGEFWDGSACTAPAFLAVARQGARRLAILAHAVVGVVTVSEEQLSQDLLPDARGRGKGAAGITEELVVLVDVQELMDRPELTVGARSLTTNASREDHGHD